MECSIVYSINDFRPICSGEKPKGFPLYNLSINVTISGLLPNNLSDIVEKTKHNPCCQIFFGVHNLQINVRF